MESKKCLSVLHDRNSSSYFAADGKVFTAVQVPLGFFFRNNVVYNWFSLSSCPLKYGSPNKHFSLYKYEQAVGSCKDIIGVTLVSRKVSVQNRPTLRDSVRSFPAPTLLECPFPRTTWVRLGHLRTGVERFRSCLYKWGMASSAVCECDAEQTFDHVVLQCPIHRPPHGLHGLTLLDETMAAQHLSRDLVRPSSGLKELTQTTKNITDPLAVA